MPDPLEEDFDHPHLDPPELNDIRYATPKRAHLEVKKESEIHWSERERLGYKPEVREPWEYGDNNKSDPEQNLEEEDNE